MKNLQRPSFFRFFDLLVSTSNPGLRHTRWTFEGAACQRARHSFTGDGHTFIVETFTLQHGGRRGWALIVVKEYWSFGDDGKGVRTTRWARPLAGKRSDLMGWLRAQEAAFDRALPARGSSPEASPQPGRELGLAAVTAARRPLAVPAPQTDESRQTAARRKAH